MDKYTRATNDLFLGCGKCLTEIKILKIEQTNEWLMGQESMAGQLWYWQSRSIKLQDDRMEIIAVEVRNNKESEHPDFFT